MIYLFSIACLAGLLVIGALIDIDCRRLPNWLTSSVAALYGLAVVVSPAPVDWMNAFVVALLVFVTGFALFSFGLMGGGDVKLMAALALWAGTDNILLFLFATSLAGGLLAIVMLMLRQRNLSMLLSMLSIHSGLIARKVLGSTAIAGSASATDIADNAAELSLPYGVAIAAGGFAVIYALLQL